MPEKYSAPMLSVNAQTETCFGEIAAILAAGVLRLRGKHAMLSTENKIADSARNPLELVGEIRPDEVTG